MSTMTSGESGFSAEITLTKGSGTLLTLPTESKYVDRNIQFTINVQSGSVTMNTPTVSNSGLVTATSTVTEGYVSSGSPSATLQLPAGTITNNTSGGTSSGTINRGGQIKIGSGYYTADAYYTAQSNSGTLTISDTSDAATNISCDGYANVNITGINVTAGNSFTVTVPNGNSTVSFVFNVDSSGNVTITES